MKKSLTLFFALFFVNLLFAQPANDDCLGLIDLGTAPICPSPAIYTNVDATQSDIGNDNQPPCFNTSPERDVWFSFTATAAIEDYLVTVSGISLTQPQVAVYRGDCEFDGLVLLDCAAANVGENETSLSLSGLTPGLNYFLRINDWSAIPTPNSGTFEICVEEFVNITYTIDESGSDLCEGTLYDTGGPNGNYSGFENNTFTICPTDPASCLVMNVTNYNLSIQGTTLSFFDGPNVNAPILADIAGGANGATQGGVCYQVVATSGCLTVNMSSFFGTAEGFEAEWYCTDDCPVDGALNLQPDPTIADIESALQNEFMDLTVTDVNCSPGAFALFSQGDDTDLGMGEGLLLTTGSAAEVSNPASVLASNDLSLPGDADLNELNDLFGFGGNTFDACVVEFDIVPKTNNLTFEYVFGSDEYKFQFSPASDDLIGILLSGPDVIGIPTLNNQLNLADLPSQPNTLVSIQSLNASTNWEYYRNNTNSQNIVYNGLSSGFLGEQKTLLADRLVTPCETYHVKIAIGDTDQNDDSGLFVNPTLSFLPAVSINPNTGISYLVEGCTNIESVVNFTLPEPLAAPTSFDVQFGGSAMEGDDYTVAIPSTITFPTGVTILSFPINIIDDGQPEGTETISFSLVQDFGCGEVVMATQTINLEDELQVQILPEGDTLFVCESINTIELQGIGATGYSWTPASIFDAPNGFTTTATINSNEAITLTGTLGSCTATDEAFLQLVDPEIEIQADGPTSFCQGDGVTLTAVNNVNNAGLTWEPTFGLQDPNSNITFTSPFATTTYTATVSAAGGCSASDEITLTVDPFNFPEMILPDTTICQGQSVQLATPVQNSSTTFEWTPDTWLDDASIAGATATPEETTTYLLNASSPSGSCTGNADVTVTVLPADIEIVPDTIELCLGDTVQIDAVTSTGGAGLIWTPTDSLMTAGAESVVVYPSTSTWYFATLVVGSCVVSDSVYVKVDSLPILDIEAIPAKAMYCQGENISLVSPNYEFLDYLGIEFMWEPNTGLVSEDSLFNLVISAVETTEYIRTTTIGACTSMDTIEIIVTPVANITVTPENPSICPGESVDLMATADQEIESWEWSPEIGLSCTDCPDPTASPPSTITYQVAGEFMGCPAFATVQVAVEAPPVYDLNPTTTCGGTPVLLNNVIDPDATYSWTDESGNVISTEAQPEVMPNVTTTYTMTITDDCGPVTDEVTVTVVQDFVLTSSIIESTCFGDTVTLFATADPAIGVDITWRPVPNPNMILIENNSEVGLTETTTFEVTAISELDCYVKTESFTINVSPEITVLAEASPGENVMAGQEVTLTAVTNVAGLQYEWFDSFDNLISTDQSTVVVSCNTAFYRVIVTDANGCTALDGIFINVENGFSLDPDSSFVLELDTMINGIYEGEEFQIGTQTIPPNIPGLTFSWLLGENGGEVVSTTNDTISEILVAPEIEGEVDTLIYTVRVADATGCPVEDTIHVVVFKNPVEMPNVFTPNNDNVNDFFLPVSRTPVEILEFQVWNRWGQLVYDNEEGDLGWNGAHNDEPALSDVYVYRIAWRIRGSTGTPKVEKGDVTLIR